MKSDFKIFNKMFENFNDLIKISIILFSNLLQIYQNIESSVY